MKIEGVIQRALEDEKYALKLRDLAYKARDEGMESRAYKALTKELAETPADLRSLNTTMGYMMVLNGTTSKIPVLCVANLGHFTVTGLPLQGQRATGNSATPTTRARTAKRTSGARSKAKPASRKKS